MPNIQLQIGMEIDNKAKVLMKKYDYTSKNDFYKYIIEDIINSEFTKLEQVNSGND